jgi:hypothetical protein
MGLIAATLGVRAGAAPGGGTAEGAAAVPGSTGEGLGPGGKRSRVEFGDGAEGGAAVWQQAPEAGGVAEGGAAEGGAAEGGGAGSAAAAAGGGGGGSGDQEMAEAAAEPSAQG